MKYIHNELGRHRADGNSETDAASTDDTDLTDSGGADVAGGASSALARLFELAVLTSEFMERGLAERGLTRARASVLWALHQRESLTQRELADLIGVTPRNVTGLLDALEADGFAARGPHPTDRRATLVALTPKGVATMTALASDYEGGYLWLFDGIEPKDLNAFVDVACTVMDRIRTIGC